MAQDLQRARELFLHAVGQVPPEQWDAYLAEACGSDDELRRQAAHLLQVHRDAGSFLERPVEGLATAAAFAHGPELIDRTTTSAAMLRADTDAPEGGGPEGGGP